MSGRTTRIERDSAQGRSHRPCGRPRLLAAVVMTLIASTTTAHAARPERVGSDNAVRVEDGRLQGRLDAAPLHRVLAAIAAQSGIAFHVHGTSHETVTIQLSGVPLEEGLRRLLRNTDFLFIYGRPDDRGTEGPTVLQVHVYRLAASTGGPEVVSGDGDDDETAAGERALSDDGTVTRRRAARARARSGDSTPVALAEAIGHEEDASVRESLARALGGTDGDETVPALAQLVAEDPDEGVRETAALALGKTWSEAAVEPLMGALGDADSTVRGAAADALANTWNDRAADALRLAAAEDPSAQVRERALTALARLTPEGAMAALRRAMEDPSPRVRRIAAEMLSMLP